MARITGASEERVAQVRRWLGLNESPGGDTRLKLGEAAEMRNFSITADGSLQLRPGTRSIVGFDGPVQGLWSGNVAGEAVLVCAADGKLWRIDTGLETKTEIGTADTSGPVSFFGYSGKLYLLNGTQYLCWDGEATAEVTGYRPLTATAAPPAGGGTAVESVNKLNGMRRVRFSPDGTATVFQLPETGLESIDYVTALADGTALEHTADLEAGTVTFSEAPAAGVSTVEIGYTVPDHDRAKVLGMRFAELYNGVTDNRVFLYGDGSNQAVYSGLDGDGNATAEYFPDLNVVNVGESNTPITSMIRHMSRLVVFKTDSAWSIYYGQITLESGALTAGFYLTPINRAIGNVAPGQVRLVTNNPRTLHGGGCYEWKGSSNLTGDERTAKRISERVKATLEAFDLPAASAFDDDLHQCYYIVHDDRALVHNYAQDAWFLYTAFPARCMALHGQELYAGMAHGGLVHISREYRNDDGAAIDAFWMSGAMDFDREWIRKMSATIWVGIKPEANARVTVTARSDRKAGYAEKVISAGLSAFDHADFAHWSFNTNRRSHIYRARLKVKKFALYQLIFQSNSTTDTSTILSVDMKIRYGGTVK